MSGTVECGKMVANVINGTNNNVKAERDMISIAQQVNYYNLYPISSRETVEKIDGAIWFDVIAPVKSFTGRRNHLAVQEELARVN
jgi:hypothetical protein